jgi:hypothetical protein
MEALYRMNRKAIGGVSPVVTTALTLIVAMIIVVAFQVWVNNYQTTLEENQILKKRAETSGSLGILDSNGGVLKVFPNVPKIESFCRDKYHNNPKWDIECKYQVRDAVCGLEVKECFCYLPTEIVYTNPARDCTLYKYPDGSSDLIGEYCPVEIKVIQTLIIEYWSDGDFGYGLRITNESMSLIPEINSTEHVNDMSIEIDFTNSVCTLTPNDIFNECRMRQVARWD